VSPTLGAPRAAWSRFHRLFIAGSCGCCRAETTIESVSSSADPTRSLHRPRSRRRALLLASALAGLAGLSLLATACGGSPASHVAQLGSTTNQTRTSPSSTTSAQSAHPNAALAFARCMRSHGVPNFPDPNPEGDFPPFHAGVSKQTSAAANDNCKHLLSSGGSTGTPQQRQQKFAFALKVAQCLRRHGFPNFPDPTASGQGLPPGIDTNSPQFQAAEANCEKQARKAVGLP
jgi:hypothetical protein